MFMLEVARETSIDTNNGQTLLFKQIDREGLESKSSGYYCSLMGRPSVSMRKMVG